MTRHFKFVEEDWTVKIATRRCDRQGCLEPGEFRAPKSRSSLEDYHWFCVEHVREYNEKWNFYAGMEDDEVEAFRRSDSTWARPTWPLGQNKFTRVLDDAIYFHPLTGCFPSENINQRVEDPNARYFGAQTDEAKALKVLDMAQPVTLEAIRKNYKEMVKKYHPDKNKGCTSSEDRLKSINVAYAVLKKSFGPKN